MKPKIMQEGPTALQNFMRAMQTVFRLPKSTVVEPKHKPRARTKTTRKPPTA